MYIGMTSLQNATNQKYDNGHVYNKHTFYGYYRIIIIYSVRIKVIVYVEGVAGHG